MELVMFVGIPASGKSTESAKYRALGYNILSSDEIRDSISGGLSLQSVPAKEASALHSQVFQRINQLCRESLKQGISVVVDATNLNRKRRIAFLKQFSSIKCMKKCVLFICPPEVCIQRNSRRSGNALVPEESMYRMLCNFECPNYWEGWDEIIPVTYDEPYNFPFEKTLGFDQENPHHKLTLDGHLASAVQYCREHNYGPVLERLARYHDIGKLYTKRYFNSRGVRTEDAHYLGHDNYGAYLYLTEMCCGKELSRPEFSQILYETNLINCHMRPLVNWKGESSTKAKDTALFGEAFIADLILLNNADCNAH